MAQAPISYKDPAWDAAEAEAAKRTGVPQEVLRAVRVHGERTDGDRISPKGARGVYQFMPKTERLFFEKYGVSAYSNDPVEQATAAAYHLKESYSRTKDWGLAAAGYNGGRAGEKNPRFTQETSDYYDRVTAALPEGIRTRIPGLGKPQQALARNEESGVPLAQPVSWEDAWAGRAPDFAVVSDDSGATRSAAPTVGAEAAFAPNFPVEASPLVPLARASQAVQEAKEAKRQEQKRWGRNDRNTTMGAALSMALTPSANAIAHVYAIGELRDEAYIARRKADPLAVYSYVENPTQDEKDLLASTQSDTDLALALTKINTDRENRGVMANVSGTEQFLMGTLGALADPVGWAAGFGVMKGFQIAGVGATALMAAGRPAAAGASLMAENALGNVLSEAGLQALGEHRSVEDYAMSALAGAGLSVPFLPSTVRAAHHSAVLKAARESYNRQAPFFKQASDELGATATPETIRERAAALEAEAHAAEAQKRLTAPGPTRRIDAPDTETMLAREAETAPESGVAGSEVPRANGDESPHFNSDTKAVADMQLEDKVARYGVTRTADELRALPAGTHLGSDVANSAAFKEVAGIVETLRAKYAPDLAIHLQRGNEASLGTMDGGATSAGPGKHIILLKPGEQLQPTAIHELGHAVFEHYAARLPDDLRGRMVQDWRKWMDSFLKDEPATEVARRRIGASRASSNSVLGQAVRGEVPGSLRQALMDVWPDNPDKGRAYIGYFTKFDEYAAEQFLKRAEQDLAEAVAAGRPLTPAQRLLEHFRALIKALKGIFDDMRKAGHLNASEGFVEFLDKAAKGELQGAQGKVQGQMAFSGSPAQPTVLDAIDAKYGTDTIDTSDVAGRMRQKYIKKLRADAEAWLAANPQDPARLKTMMDNKLFDISTPGHVLAASDDPLAKMYAALVVEDAMGAGGRHDTASIRKFMVSQSLIGSSVIDYDRELTAWATGQRGWARSVADSLTKGELQDKFNKAVFTEIENRLHQRPSTQDGNVLRAADSVQSAMERMRLAQVDNKTAGWGALPTTSVGYLPHRFNAAALMALEPEAQRALVDVLRGQLIDLNGFDEAFADRIAKVYVQHARTNANAGHEIPGNMHDPAAAHYVEEAMRAQGMTRDEIQQYANKLRAGAMSHTKKRLKLDLSAEYAPGKQLMELYHTDIPSLLKGQAERVGGEVALTQSGIMGSAGLKMIEDALSFKPAGMTAEAHKKMMEAFQQTAAEMLDRPWRNESGQVQWANRAMQANSLASLGGMGFSQLQEGVNIGLTLGISHAMHSISEVPKLIGEVQRMARGEKVENSVLHSMEQFGGGGEFGMSDYKMVLKLDDPAKVHTAVGQDGITALDRALRMGGQALSIVSFHRMVTAVQVRSAAVEITSKALRYIRDGKESRALADMGFTPEVIAAFKADLDKAVEWRGDAIKSFDITKVSNTKAASQFIAAVHRGSRQIIQGSFVGEKHRWQHSAIGRIATQFRTFPLVAMEKQLGRQRATHGAATVLGMVLAAFPFVATIQAARVLAGSIGRDDADAYIEKRLSPEALARASLNYLGVLGLIPDVVNGLTTMLPAEVDQALGGEAGGRHGQKGLASVVPIAGWGDKVVKAATNEGAKKVSPLLSVTPLNNTPLLAPLTNLLRDAAK